MSYTRVQQAAIADLQSAVQWSEQRVDQGVGQLDAVGYQALKQIETSPGTAHTA